MSARLIPRIAAIAGAVWLTASACVTFASKPDASVTSPTGQAAVAPKSSVAVPALDLKLYQTSEGLIQTFADGTVADPYFGLYAIELARRGGLDVSGVETKFIAWGLREQKGSGHFERYCRKANTWTRCGRSDSDDATLARWIHLLYAATPERQPLPAAWAASARQAESALMALRMSNGIFSVFPADTPGYAGYALFKDNVEVLSVFTRLSAILARRGETERSQLFANRARDLRKAMRTHFGDKPFSMKRLALGADYDKARFYPHAVAIPFGWLEHYYAAPAPEEWNRWLSAYTQDWLANARSDFPWGLTALAALYTGPSSVAGCWVERHQAQSRSLHRWNVLEEVALQVLAHAQPSAANCPAYTAGA